MPPILRPILIALCAYLLFNSWLIVSYPEPIVDVSIVRHVEKVEAQPWGNPTIETKIRFATIGGWTSAETALRIADCESKMGTQVINPTSTARGVFQFTQKTWNHYCDGEVMDVDDNIQCFIKLYPDHKDWWECK